MRENKEITSRDQVIAAAQRQEELAEQQSKKEPKPEGQAKETPAFTKRFASATRGSYTSTLSFKEKSGKAIKCFQCGKFGHVKDECTAAPQNEKSENKEQAKKWKPKS